jgi:hypothetical protein
MKKFKNLLKNLWFLISLFVILFSIGVLAETGTFYWYDNEWNVCGSCSVTLSKGYFSYPCNAPLQTLECCNTEGSIRVRFYPDTGSYVEKNPAYTINWDANPVDCTCYGKTPLPSGTFFDSGTLPYCCGDDAGEYYTTRGLGTACCNQGGTNACVAYSGRCRYEYNTETSCHDGLDNDCNGKPDCIDSDCQTGTETDCRDKINNDCDAYTDCSDADCGMSLDCIGCTPETDETTCSDGLDNDCDNYIDCVDSDCIDTEICPCEPVTEICDDIKDNDCDGKKDCMDEDCFDQTACKAKTCVTENTVALCSNGKDDDCDSLVDNLDRDCPGCSMNTKLCADGSCKESCDPANAQGCVGTANGNCEEGEGCACEDCLGKRDSCDREIICDSNDKTCKCPSGTTMCSDGRCRKKCFVCGDGKLEEGEECDGGTTICPDGCTGEPLTCKADCTWDTSGCSCPQCDPTKIDKYCCVIPGDGKCDSECTANADSDCAGKCTFYSGDCCEDSKDGECDTDCINYKDPDCSTSCSNQKDDCCNVNSDSVCDPDCDYNPDTKVFIDPDCKTKFPDGCTNSQGDCCNNNNDAQCDLDCITGVDTDCKCSNGIIDTGETCDTTDLDTKTCNNFFLGYGGLLACFNTDGEHACHFDTSGCHKIPEVCTGGSCSFLKDCRCPECVGQQSSCGYGAVCDATARCACIDGTTLCEDSTCRTAQNCKDYDGGEQLCTGTANGVCDVGEGCGCSDCEGKKGPCNALSACQNGVCTGCFLKKAYWADINTGVEEGCVGSGNDIKMTIEGTLGCEDKTVNFKMAGISQGSAVFKNSKAELVWPANTITGEDKSSYKFDANLEGGSDKITSINLDVEYCVKECDADCDHYVDSNLRNTPGCIAKIGSGKKPSDPEKNYPKTGKDPDTGEEGVIILDANALSGWCENCDPNGLSKGQETCAAYYDCTPGWWGDDTNYNGAGTAAEARTVLEWGDCGVPKVEPPNQLGQGRQSISGNMRNRLICPPGLTRQQCCANQASCYCERPEGEDMVKKGLNCDLPEFRPTEIKACLSEEKFPFFTNMNILIVVLILTGFYIWKTRKD